MKILAIIPARQHSTRIKNKNLVKIKKKSLVEIAINSAKEQKLIFDILISSDSKKINQIANNNGIKYVQNRNMALSSNFSTSYMTVSNAIKWYESKYCSIDAVILLQPTSPFRNEKFINLCIKKFLKFKKPIVSVYPCGFKKNNIDSDGSVYIIGKKVLFRARSFDNLFSIKIKSNNFIESLDIDNFKDYEKAIKLSHINLLNKND